MLVVSLVLSVVSLVLLFGVTWYFQSSLDLLQQQVEYDRKLLFKLQEQFSVSWYTVTGDIANPERIKAPDCLFLDIRIISILNR